MRLASDTEGGSVAILLGGEQSGLSACAQVQNNEAIDILLWQASLGLRRIQLLRDLARERIDKESELLCSSLLSSESHDFRTPLGSLIQLRGDRCAAGTGHLQRHDRSPRRQCENW